MIACLLVFCSNNSDEFGLSVMRMLSFQSARNKSFSINSAGKTQLLLHLSLSFSSIQSSSNTCGIKEVLTYVRVCRCWRFCSPLSSPPPPGWSLSHRDRCAPAFICGKWGVRTLGLHRILYHNIACWAVNKCLIVTVLCSLVFLVELRLLLLHYVFPSWTVLFNHNVYYWC